MDTKFECDIYMCVCVNNMTIQGAIKSANNTKYGLTACIVTKSLDIANTVKSIHAGIIWINCYFAFGRDFGMEALYKYLQVKSVVSCNTYLQSFLALNQHLLCCWCIWLHHSAIL